MNSCPQLPNVSNPDMQHNIRSHHSDMTMALSKRFRLKSNDWSEVMSQVESRGYISERDMDDVNNMMDLCKALMKKGIIEHGNYGKLRDILVKYDVMAGHDIDKCTELIHQERKGQKAKAQRNEDIEHQEHRTANQRGKRKRTEEQQETNNADEERPKQKRKPNEEQPKRKRKPNEEQPKRKRKPNEEQPKRKHKPNEEQPKRKRKPNEEQPKRKRKPNEEQPKWKQKMVFEEHPQDSRQQQSSDCGSRIAMMIEGTKDMIREENARPFVTTKGFKDAKEKLIKNHVVVLKGNNSDGKTTLARRLLKMQEQNGGQPVQLNNMEDLDLVYTKQKLVVFIDDIFGNSIVREQDLAQWDRRTESVIPTMHAGQHPNANFVIITIRNEVFNSLGENSLANIFVDENIIDLSSNDYIIREDRLELLGLYTPANVSWEDNEKEDIALKGTRIGFPECCRLFRDTPEVHNQRVLFFKKPIHFWRTLLHKQEECHTLLFLFLNKGSVLEKDLDPNGDKVNKTFLKQAFDINLKTVWNSRFLSLNDEQKIGFLRKRFEILSGSFVVKERKSCNDDSEYRFADNSLNITVALLYGQITPTGFIQHCPSELLSLLTISKSSTYRIKLSSDNYDHVFKRLFEEMMQFRIPESYSQFSLDVWKDREFIERFYHWLIHKKLDNIDLFMAKMYAVIMKRVLPDEEMGTIEKVYTEINNEMKLFNKSVLLTSAKCALYHLYQGIRSKEVKKWWSTVTKVESDDVDKDILEEVYKYIKDTNLQLFDKTWFCVFVGYAVHLLCHGIRFENDTEWFSLITKVAFH